jgi:hypothetical protein
MKRDKNLIREILLAVEASESGWAPGPEEYNIEGYTAEQINYHALLLVDAGFAMGQDMSMMSGPAQGYISRLTWDGHEFLDVARDDSRWNQAQSIAKEKVGSVTMEVLKAILVELMKKTVGLS